MSASISPTGSVVAEPTPTADQGTPIEPRKRRGRLMGGGLGAALVTAAVVVFTVPGIRNHIPAGVPLIGKSADSVWSQIKDSGLAVTEGEPSAKRFNEMVYNNRCGSSRSFVQSEGDTGWALICVNPPRDVYRSMRRAFDGSLALMGPMWVDQDDGEVIIFGFGWPGRSSEQIAKAIGGDARYLTFQGT